MKALFYLRYAARSLWRGGQRSLLAIFCIAFGVLAVVSMQQLAAMIEASFLIEPHLKMGGDVTLTPPEAHPLDDAYRQTLADWEEQGLLDTYTLTAPGSSILLRTEASGKVHFVGRVLGVDPSTYPLYGTIAMQTPSGLTFAQALTTPRDAVVTYDLAEKTGVQVGDMITLSGGPGGPPARLRVRGIAAQVPDRFGNSLFYSLETAQVLRGGTMPPLNVMARWGESGDEGPRFEAAGWTVERAKDQPKTASEDLFTFMLGGAGILGLLIGGIGVANTMKVILARRTQEIATLKTVGYQQRHLLLLFGVETALMGVIGGIVGVGAALLLSREFMQLLDYSIVFMMEYTLDPWIIAGGLLIGVLTAMIFGLAAIIRASIVRPGVLLRDLPVQPTWRSRITSGSLYLLLWLLFTVLSSVLLGSVLKGVGVVAFGLTGLVVLGALFAGLLLLLVRIPVPGMPLLGMARRNLRHHPIRAVYALIALFVGVFSIGFSAATLLNAQQQAEARVVSTDGYNLILYASLPEHDRLLAFLEKQPEVDVRSSFTVTAQTRTTADSLLGALGTLEGRWGADPLQDVTLEEGLWQDDPAAAYVPQWVKRSADLSLGDTLHVTTESGSLGLYIAGFYTPGQNAIGFGVATRNLLVHEQALHHISQPTVATTYMVAAPSDRLAAFSDELGSRFPQAVVISKADIGAYLNQIFRGLFMFVMAVAGLAFVAGAVLIANAVGLSMIERRRELGILKAIGYTSSRVIQTVLLENALLGLLSGVMGLLGVLLAMTLINMQFDEASLVLTWWQGLALVGLSVVLALGSAAAVAWHPTHLRPLAVLRSD